MVTRLVREANCVIMYVERVLKCGLRPMNTVYKKYMEATLESLNLL